MALEEIGKTAEGRPQLMAIVTSPANQKKLARYKEISRRLALAEGLSDEQARALAREGKAVVWIDGGLHATEVLGAQQLARDGLPDGQPHRRGNDAVPGRRIMLFVHANPDGNDLVCRLVHAQRRSVEADDGRACPGSTRNTSGTTTIATSSPRPRPKPRTSTACSTTSGSRRSSTTITRAGRPGRWCGRRRMRDPYNYNLDPLLILGLQALGTHMHQRLAVGGQARRDDGVGRARTTAGGTAASAIPANFHNIIAILTEMIGSPTPMRIPLVLQRQIPNARPALPDRAAGVALPAVDRLLDLVQPGGDRLWRAQPREPALRHLPDGPALDRARQHRHVDAVAVADQRRERAHGWRRQRRA